MIWTMQESNDALRNLEFVENSDRNKSFSLLLHQYFIKSLDPSTYEFALVQGSLRKVIKNVLNDKAENLSLYQKDIKQKIKIKKKQLDQEKNKFSFRRNQRKILNDSIQELLEEKSKVDSLIQKIKQVIQKIKQVNYNELDLINLFDILEIKEPELMLHSLEYKNYEKKLNQLIKKAKDLNCSEYLDNNRKIELQDIKTISELIKRISNISLSGRGLFSNIFIKILKNKFSETKIKLNNSFQFSLYAKLQFCKFCFNKPSASDKLLFIDEGQDISINEYKLLKEVNDDNVIFNVFGDTNQLIKKDRGLSNFKKLELAIHSKYFEIKENYRNTKNITTYCNKVFGYSAIAIGPSGENVRFIELGEAMNEIKNKTIKSERIAIIVNDTSDEVVCSFIDEFSNKALLKDIKKGYITVLDVVSSKGLEFDEVYVLPKDMTKNEQYISFTRALSKLIIVS